MNPNFPKCFKVETKPHKFCPGCGYGIILKSLGKVIDEMGIQGKTVFMTDIGCNLLAWDFYDIPTCQTHHGRTVATAAGFKMAEPSKNVICLIGDGGGYAIGLQNLIHACLRNSSITIILVNNTNYGMTGGQASPTTLVGQVTDTTPFGKTLLQGKSFYGPEILRQVSNANSFIARTSTLKPEEIKSFIKKALEAQNHSNFSFVEVISACPLNWRTNASETIKKMKELEKIYPQGELK